jgi:hypothetical protein
MTMPPVTQPEKVAADDAAQGAPKVERSVVTGAEPQDPPRRKFARELAPVEEEPIVRCRVTRRGGDKISTGRHEPTLGDEKFMEGEIIDLPLSVALAQRDTLDAAGNARDYIEILEG